MKTFENGVYTGQITNKLQYEDKYKSIDKSRIEQLKDVVYTRLKNIGAMKN